MLRINKKVEYGVMALLHLGTLPESVASVREISELSGISETLLSKVMQRLKAAGFVDSVHGNQGGYRLTKDLANISLLEVAQWLSGPVSVAECLQPGSDTCPVKQACTLVSPMNVLNQKIIRVLKETSLDSLTERKVAV